MSENQTEPKRLRRFQFRLTTVFWLAFSVSCFFAGMYWDEMSESAVPNLVGNRISIPSGNSTTITANAPIPEIRVTDPAICVVTPISPTRFRVQALKSGTAEIQISDPNGIVTNYSIDVPK